MRHGIVLLLAAALAVLPAPVPGQGGTPWAPAGNEPPPGQPVVIATNQPRKETPALPPDARLPLPDDGLRPPLPAVAPTATARPAPPRPLSQHAIQPVRHEEVAAPPAGSVVPATPVPPPPASEGNASTLSLQVSGPVTIQQGEPLVCVIMVRNPGPLILAGVRVELPLPSGVRLLATDPPASQGGDRPGWNLGNLEAGAQHRLRVELQASDTDGLHLRPVATFSAAVGLRSRVVVPPFGLQIGVPESAAPGDRVVLRVQLSNRTARPLRRIALHCELGEGLVHPQGQVLETDLPGELAPGQVRTLELPTQARSAGTVRATFEARTEDGLTARAQASVLIREPMLQLVHQGPRHGNTGQVLDFRLELSNPGRASTGLLRVTQVLPDGLEFLNASTGGMYNPTTQTLTWALDALTAGERRAVTFRVRGRRMGDWALHAAAGVEGAREVRATHAVHLTAAPLLALELTAHDDPITTGQTTSYEVRVINQGTVAARQARVRILVPDHLIPVQADGPTRWQIHGQHVLFEPVVQMPTRTDAVYRIHVRGLRPGSGRFRAELSAEGLPQSTSQELTSHVRDNSRTAPIASR